MNVECSEFVLNRREKTARVHTNTKTMGKCLEGVQHENACLLLDEVGHVEFRGGAW